jgi:DNA polymerase-3 subunit chi
MRVDFYHLVKNSLEETASLLLEKAYSAGNKVLFLVSSEDKAEELSEYLWSYKEESFLPHGTLKDGFKDKHPIFVTSDLSENFNDANILVLADGVVLSDKELDSYDRILNVFDGNSISAVEQARVFWKELKNSGSDLHYWQQNVNGAWTEKV